MPSVLEPDFARVESLALEAVQNGHLAPEQVEVLRSYFARLEKEVLADYQADRNVARRMHGRFVDLDIALTQEPPETSEEAGKREEHCRQ
jgi:hypothetical protein